MLKWIIKRNPSSGHMFVEGKPWGVYLGGFRDSSHENKWLAQQRINELIEQEARWAINETIST